MRKPLEDAIRRLLKVPPQPEPPLGAEGSVQIFRAAQGFYRYRMLGWGIRQASALIGILALLIFLSFYASWPLQKLFAVLESIGIVLLVVQAVFSYLMISLDFQYRWYMITDRSLRIREGLIKVQERTMTFSNIQNVSIRQGPLQRYFGISDLEVRTAGGSSGHSGDQQSGSHDNLHLGYFRGVANASEIRDAILRHLRHLRTTGLGDPDEAVTAASSNSTDPTDMSSASDDAKPGAVLAAGRQVLAETRALRELMTAS